MHSLCDEWPAVQFLTRTSGPDGIHRQILYFGAAGGARRVHSWRRRCQIEVQHVLQGFHGRVLHILRLYLVPAAVYGSDEKCPNHLGLIAGSSSVVFDWACTCTLGCTLSLMLGALHDAQKPSNR